MSGRDPDLEFLLSLDGTAIVMTEDGRFVVSFRVSRTEPGANRPHGLKYALNLHGPGSGKARDNRLVGFDNAHGIKGTGPARIVLRDHKYRLSAEPVPYEYSSAGRLLEDFWAAVEQMLGELGMRP